MLDATGVHAVERASSTTVTSSPVPASPPGSTWPSISWSGRWARSIAHAVEELFAHERRGTVWRARGLEPTTI